MLNERYKMDHRGTNMILILLLYKDCSETKASYFIMVAHDIRDGCL